MRDEILSCDNTGRMKRLLLSWPNVEHIHYQLGWTTWITITTTDGSEHLYHKSGQHEAVKDACLGMYFQWLKNFNPQ